MRPSRTLRGHWPLRSECCGREDPPVWRGDRIDNHPRNGRGPGRRDRSAVHMNSNADAENDSDAGTAGPSAEVAIATLITGIGELTTNTAEYDVLRDAAL